MWDFLVCHPSTYLGLCFAWSARSNSVRPSRRPCEARPLSLLARLSRPDQASRLLRDPVRPLAAAREARSDHSQDLGQTFSRSRGSVTLAGRGARSYLLPPEKSELLGQTSRRPYEARSDLSSFKRLGHSRRSKGPLGRLGSASPLHWWSGFSLEWRLG